MNNISNQNPIETLFSNSGNIPDVIYLCENGLSHLLNKTSSDEEVYNMEENTFSIKKSNKTILNKYFNSIWQFTDHNNEVSDFLNDYCIKHFKDNSYLKDEKSPADFIKSLQVAEKLLLYFYGQIVDPVYTDEHFIKNIVRNFEKYMTNPKGNVIYDLNFEHSFNIIFNESYDDAINNTCPDLIHDAVKGDSIKAVDFLIQRGFDINYIDKKGYSCAFKAKSPKMLEKLLSYNVDLINQKNKRNTILSITEDMGSEEKAKFNAVLKKHINSKKDVEQYYTKDYVFIDTIKSFKESLLTKKSFVKLWNQNNIKDIDHVFEYDGRKTSILGHLLQSTKEKIKNQRNIMDTVISSRLAIARFLMENGASLDIISNKNNEEEKDKNLLILLIETIHAKKSYTLPGTSSTKFEELIGKQIKQLNWDSDDFEVGLKYLKRQQDASRNHIICHTVDYLYSLFSPDENNPLGYSYQKPAFDIIEQVLMEALGKKDGVKYQDNNDDDRDSDILLTLDDFNNMNFKDYIMEPNGDLRMKNNYLGLITEIFDSELDKNSFVNFKYDELGRQNTLLKNANALVNHLQGANKHAQPLMNILDKKKQIDVAEDKLSPEFPVLYNSLSNYYFQSLTNDNHKKRKPVL